MYQNCIEVIFSGKIREFAKNYAVHPAWTFIRKKQKIAEYLKSVISREATRSLQPLLIRGRGGEGEGENFNSETISSAEGLRFIISRE